MKVKELAAWLAKLDPEAVVVVREYDGGDDAPREVQHVDQITTACVAVGEWPSVYDKDAEDGPYRPLIPNSENVVLISALFGWNSRADRETG